MISEVNLWCSLVPLNKWKTSWPWRTKLQTILFFCNVLSSVQCYCKLFRGCSAVRVKKKKNFLPIFDQSVSKITNMTLEVKKESFKSFSKHTLVFQDLVLLLSSLSALVYSVWILLAGTTRSPSDFVTTTRSALSMMPLLMPWTKTSACKPLPAERSPYVLCFNFYVFLNHTAVLFSCFKSEILLKTNKKREITSGICEHLIHF